MEVDLRNEIQIKAMTYSLFGVFEETQIQDRCETT